MSVLALTGFMDSMMSVSKLSYRCMTSGSAISYCVFRTL